MASTVKPASLCTSASDSLSAECYCVQYSLCDFSCFHIVLAAAGKYDLAT